MPKGRPLAFDAAAFIAAHQAVGNIVTIEVGLGGRPAVSVGAIDGLNPISLRLARKFARQRRADPGYLDNVRQALVAETSDV